MQRSIDWRKHRELLVHVIAGINEIRHSVGFYNFKGSISRILLNVLNENVSTAITFSSMNTAYLGYFLLWQGLLAAEDNVGAKIIDNGPVSKFPYICLHGVGLLRVAWRD